MVMLSDSESGSKEVTPMATGDVRDTGVTPPEHLEEPPDKTDSLLMFPSEGTTDEASDSARTISVTQPSRPVTGYRVPAAIIDDRAAREAISKLDAYLCTLEKLEATCASIDKRLEKAEETLRRTEEAITDGRPHELSARVDSRLVETEQAVLRIEQMVVSGVVDEKSAIQELRGYIGGRLEQAEEIVRRTEKAIADRTVHDLSAYIDTRVMGTEEVVRRIEELVARRSHHERAALQAIHADIDRRLSQAEKVFRQRLASERHSVHRDDQGSDRGALRGRVQVRWQQVMKPLVAVGALVGASVLATMMTVSGTRGLQPVARLVDRELQVRDALVEASAPSAPVPASTPVRLQLTARVPARSTPPSLPRPPAPAPTRRAVTPTDGVASSAFVGDLSIVSTPAGARVFINGRAVGVTPLVLRERQAGSVAIQIANEGFERWSASVQVRAGQMTNVAATLRPARP